MSGCERGERLSLVQYRKKRKFRETPEPTGKTRRGRGALHFVVQKHRASRLHYDFRLELDGVLKSWAIPKGPSLSPDDKRLAVMVEDHPLEYRTFEGSIPEGNYGAGTVMVWDEGTYTVPESRDPDEVAKVIRDGLKRGRFHFILHGLRLGGEFTIFKLARGKGNEWLLAKKRDPFASTELPSGEDRSVLSHRTMDQIAATAGGEGKVWHSHAKPVAPKRVRARMPHHIKPMLATLVDEAFDRPGWLFEIKFDGYRTIAEVQAGRIRLLSRKGLSFNEKFAPIVRALQDFGHDAVLDGEVVVVDAAGKPDFQLLQAYPKSGGRLVYYVFDLLYIDGQDLRSQPLRRRKELLKPLLRGAGNVIYSDHIEQHGTAFFKSAAAQELEGIVGKRADSVYQGGRRSPDWVKIKTHRRQEAVIAGFTEPRGGRTDLGALVLGVHDGPDLVYIGHAGTGMADQTLAQVRAQLQPLLRKACPFKKKPKTNAAVHWVEPRLVCEVKFREWTSDGQMRQPVFVGLRDDKPARSIRRERSLPPAAVISPNHEPKGSRSKPRTGRHNHEATNMTNDPPAVALKKAHVPFAFTNLDKIFFPEDGYTKGDVIAYYQHVSSFMLPHLRDRPLSMNRHPDGIHGKSFFQKDVTNRPTPAWVETVDLPTDSSSKNRTKIRYVLCQNEATLLYMAQLGCIEINCWNSRVGKLDRPDYLVIDLDPIDVPFEQVVEAAQGVRQVVEKSGADCFCKTSGKRGMHIYVPLAAAYDYEHARAFAEIIARIVNRRLPATTSLVRDPARRQNRVYIDFLQNSRGQTMAAPYSVRPVLGGLVSTPLLWKEVKKNLDPSHFTIRTVPQRLEKTGDIWQKLLTRGADLLDCIKALEASR
jgi:bifunctional non-homologous end joining protein LigD